jgi:hypothetical protein
MGTRGCTEGPSGTFASDGGQFPSRPSAESQKAGGVVLGGAGAATKGLGDRVCCVATHAATGLYVMCVTLLHYSACAVGSTLRLKAAGPSDVRSQ